MNEIEQALKELWGEVIDSNELEESAKSLLEVFKLLQKIEEQNQHGCNSINFKNL